MKVKIRKMVAVVIMTCCCILLNSCMISALLKTDKGADYAQDLAVDFIENHYGANISIVSCEDYSGDAMGDYARIIVLHDDENDFDFSVIVCLRGYSVSGFDYEREWVVDESYKIALDSFNLAKNNKNVDEKEIMGEYGSCMYSITINVYNINELPDAIGRLVEWSLSKNDGKEYYIKLNNTEHVDYESLKLYRSIDENNNITFGWNSNDDNYMNMKEFINQDTEYFLKCYTATR